MVVVHAMHTMLFNILMGGALNLVLAMVQAIRSHPTPLQIYEKRLLEEGIVSKEEMSSITDNVQSVLSSEFDGAKVGSISHHFEHTWGIRCLLRSVRQPTCIIRTCAGTVR